jgi:acetolactate synthase-1/3 small subunit
MRQVHARRFASLTGFRGSASAAASTPALWKVREGKTTRARALLVVRAAADDPAAVARSAPLAPGNDVYGGPARLKEGLRRQTMLIYVADETGMINRVAGVFARRGYNIESLAVGLNIDKALFTVVVIASDTDATKLIKQINKLAKVRKVENVTNKMCVERGLMLIKVRGGAGGACPSARSQTTSTSTRPHSRRRPFTLVRDSDRGSDWL